MKLNKALYELWYSSILWQQMLKNILQAQEFKKIPHESCCMACNSILIFFYVDNIMFAYWRKDQTEVQWIMKSLKKKFELLESDPLQ